jgi:two-component system, OmpR family, phosphate regulon sensor histidine kinase PhoR
VSRHTERLSSLIEDLLELSRLESPRTRLEMAPLRLAAAAGRVLELMESEAGARGVTLVNEVPKELPEALADSRSLEQVFVNLLDNAIKWTPAGGSVVVGAEPAGNRLKAFVTDSGAGIPPADLPRLFERFYRVDRSRAREPGGTGLGLAIVKRLVQLHGGEVGVESAVGKGSTFWFTLPVCTGEETRSGAE